MPNQDGDRLQLLADIAEWYYIEGLSQQEITKRVNLSRPSISRLLEEARTLNLVEIVINRPIPTDHFLEGELISRFRLRAAHVLNSAAGLRTDTFHQLGRLGAVALETTIQDGVVLGLSWGTTVHAVIEALRPKRLPNVKVVQLLGGVGAPYRTIDGPEQVRRVGELFGAQHYYLNAPMLVDNPDVAAALREDHSIKQVLELAQKTDIALVGIGPIIPDLSTQYHSGYVTFDDLIRLEKQGVIGAMCMSYFDAQGEAVSAPWCDDCSISVSWKDLTRIPTVIGVAGGKRKAPAILGALRSGIIHILVTDDIAAESILKLDQEATKGR